MSIRIVPANEAAWSDVQSILSSPGDQRSCQCQWLQLSSNEFKATTREERTAALREQTNAGRPGAGTTSGLVAFVDDEAAAWVAVEPRVNYGRLRRSRTVWKGRSAEDREDPGVWAITCFVVRREFRGQGLMRALTAAAADFARERGATAVEGYPRDPSAAGGPPSADSAFVGLRSVFDAAGFEEVSHPTDTRVVMRREFRPR